MEIIAEPTQFILFQSCNDIAAKTEINDPDAMAVASVDKDGMLSVRKESCCGDGHPKDFCFLIITKAVNR